MLCNVEAFCFFLLVDTDAEDELDEEEENEGTNEGKERDAECANELRHESNFFASESFVSEKGYREGSPDSANTVNGDGSYWVIDFNFI